MKTKTEKSNLRNIQNTLPSDGEACVVLLNQRRRAIGVFSVFAAVPVMGGAEVQEAQAADVKEPVTGVPALIASRIEMLKDRCGKSKLLGHLSDYRSRQTTGKIDIVSEFAGGGDSCPGTAIPGGRYTAAAPFVDNGDTTGARDDVIAAPGCFFYSASYLSLRGPDLVYSFTLTGRGAHHRFE